MSKNIEKNKSFLSLILSTTFAQQKALLYSLSDSQSNLISEIVKNIISLDKSTSLKQLIRKYRATLSKLSSRNISIAKRKQIIKSKYKIILKLLLLAKQELLAL